jgi:site-specific DNA-methyltransferase (adenine-specific)
MLDFTKRKPDILDCLANLSNDEVFTPPALANKILDLLPPEVWTNKDVRFLDPACKSGVFLREAAKRLMEGLRDAIQDEATRREHIFKNMLFGMAITELTAHITRRSLYYSKDPSSDRAVVKMDTPDGNIFYENTEHSYKGGSCEYCGAPESANRARAGLENHAYRFIHGTCPHIMKFDVIVGNPPYQLKDGEGGNGSSATPLYQKFVNEALKMSPRYVSMIIPARWFAGGKGLDEFRSAMLGDRRIRALVDFPDAGECFPGVSIEGGVCYFLWDREYGGKPTDKCLSVSVQGGTESRALRTLNKYDVYLRFNQAESIVDKVRLLGEKTFDSQVSSSKPFGLRANFEDFKDTSFKGATAIYARGRKGWVDPSKIRPGKTPLSAIKVLVSKAYGNGSGAPYQVISPPIIAEPNSCCTETYLVCGTPASYAEAENLVAYMKTKFFRFLLSLRKLTQNISRDKFAFIPALDMSIRWDDKSLYSRYSLTDDEIAYIEATIREMP